LKQLSTIREKLKGMTPQEIAAEVLLRVERRASRAIHRAVDSVNAAYISDKALRRALKGATVSEVAARMRESRAPRLTAGLADLRRTSETIKQFFPESIDLARREANDILNRRINVFGIAYDLGPYIDWHRDPRSGLRWPLEHSTRISFRLGQGSDVRQVWELNRLYHLTTLGRAYALTNDERYADEFLIQIASWYEDNPPRYGVNWTNAMEAALRAVNIIAASQMFISSERITDEAIELILKTLLAHGRFIRANLEYSRRATSNHYLSDLIGLFVIGMTMPDFSESAAWAAYSAPRLLKEMDKQILSDGADYESSIAYHRFALEIYALFFSLSSASGIEIPGRYWERLEAMFDFVRAYLKPDGTAPLLGDSDDGRLIAFKQRPAVDHSYLMPMAAILVENESFKLSSRIDEEAIWWFGEQGREAFESFPINEQPVGSKAFADAQIFIQREGELYAIIDCGDHGARGRGSHAHSDALSFETFAYGRALLRDPGSYVYTASSRWRNLFRSTAYHNAARVDGQEISLIDEAQLFALGPNVVPRINRWESDANRDLLDAEHYGYRRLKRPITHRRVITFNKSEGYWVVEDYFMGEGARQFEFFFNFDAGLEATIESDYQAVARDERVAILIAPLSEQAFEAKITSRWVSLSYGTRVRSSGIMYRLFANAPLKNAFLLAPYRVGEEEKVKRIQESEIKNQKLNAES
jgi:heparinase II/III-like protein